MFPFCAPQTLSQESSIIANFSIELRDYDTRKHRNTVLPQTTSLKASNANAIEMKSAKISSVDLKYTRKVVQRTKQSTSRHLQCVPKNETRVILNILYSCKSIAIKFSTWYPMDIRDITSGYPWYPDVIFMPTLHYTTPFFRDILTQLPGFSPDLAPK